MVLELYKENVDIYVLPQCTSTQGLDNPLELSIGDLHGNPIKLLFMLFKHGIATGLSDDDYKKLIHIYKTPYDSLSKENLEQFDQILAKISFKSLHKIRLIGDEFADRGNNDYFTLLILSKLRKNNIPYEILISNHGAEFITAYETKNNFHPSILQYEHARSMEHMQKLIDKGLVTHQQVMELIRTAYEPALLALSYTLNDDKTEITIYSHAGIGLDNLNNIAKKLDVPYKDSTAAELADTINAINLCFKIHVENHTVHTLFTNEKMFQGYCGFVSSQDAFEFLMWNRSYDTLHRPEFHHQYKINFVHGHDDKDLTQKNIINLDTELGKHETLHQGVYLVLAANKKSYKLSKESEQIWNEYSSYIKSLEKLINECSTNQKHQENLKKFKTSVENAFDYYFLQAKTTGKADLKKLSNELNHHVKEIKSAIEYDEPSLWNKLHPIIKSFLGIIALLTVLPALIVQFSTSKGFVGTFFTPVDKSSTAKAFEAQGLESPLKKI